jgi:hypothetical protein
MAFGEYWDSCRYTDGVLDYNQVGGGTHGGGGGGREGGEGGENGGEGGRTGPLIVAISLTRTIINLGHTHKLYVNTHMHPPRTPTASAPSTGATAPAAPRPPLTSRPRVRFQGWGGRGWVLVAFDGVGSTRRCFGRFWTHCSCHWPETITHIPSHTQTHP